MERRLSDKDCSQSGTATTNRTFCGESGEALSSAIEREGQGRIIYITPVFRVHGAPGVGPGTAEPGVSTANNKPALDPLRNIARLRIKYLLPIFLLIHLWLLCPLNKSHQLFHLEVHECHVHMERSSAVCRIVWKQGKKGCLRRYCALPNWCLMGSVYLQEWILTRLRAAEIKKVHNQLEPTGLFLRFQAHTFTVHVDCDMRSWVGLA